MAPTPSSRSAEQKTPSKNRCSIAPVQILVDHWPAQANATRSARQAQHPACPTAPRRVGCLSLALCWLAIGCASAGAPRFESVTQLDDEAPRRAPGVSIDPVSELPPSQPRGDTATGVVMLRAPADAAQGREAVKRFFRAVSTESIEDLEAELHERAQILFGSGARLPVGVFWRQRFSKLDYASLAGSTLYRDRELETYRGADLSELSPPPRFPIAVPRDAILIKVKLAMTRTGRTRMFGDVMLFLLRPEADGYKISEVVEEFQLP